MDCEFEIGHDRPALFENRFVRCLKYIWAGDRWNRWRDVWFSHKDEAVKEK